jgi:WD40 repeat protein
VRLASEETGEQLMTGKTIWHAAKIAVAALVIIVLGAILVIRAQHFIDPAAEAPMASNVPPFEGRISALSDLDQAASGYANGNLLLLQGQSDQLSVIDGDAVTSVPVSNSVIGWVTTHRRSPDGRFIYVAEIRGQAPAGTEQIVQPYANFPQGNLVTVVDTAQPTPVVVARINAGKNPGTLDVNPSGDLLAVGTDEAGAQIRLWNLENGLPVGEPIDVAMPYPESNRPGVRAIRFDPSGNFLAANLSDRAIGFFAVSRDPAGRVTGLTPHGNVVSPDGTTRVLTEVEFTPDGRFLLVPDVQWGTQTTWPMLTTKPGRLLSIRFDNSAAARHVIASSVEVGRSPEGMEVSPDGRFAVTVNMERSYLPDMPGLSWIFGGKSASSLSLISIDPESGRLSARPTVRLPAILPEDVIFDATGRGLALAIYERPGDGRRERGFVDFWRIAGDGASARLERTTRSVQLPRGVHDLELLPSLGKPATTRARSQRQ